MLARIDGYQNRLLGSHSTPLMLAAQSMDEEAVRWLLENGHHGQQELGWAVTGAQPEVVELLLALGVNPHFQDANGGTLLLVSADKVPPQITHALLQAGVNPDLANNYRITPLLRVAFKGDLPVMKLLLQHGANPNHADLDGDTPLIMAATYGHAQAVQLLLAHGANPLAATDYGITALMKAAAAGHVQVVQLLADRGLGARNRNGHTALELAEKNGRDQVVDVLRKAAGV